MTDIANNKDYSKFLADIKSAIQIRHTKAVYAVNREQMALYQSIGELIVQKQDQFGWGKSIVEQLSTDLTKLFPTATGYSVQNLWYMRQFYLEYRDFPNLQQLVGEIPWGHNLLIMSKLKNADERQFYIKATIDMKWSRNVLLNQIKANTYQRQAIATKQHNFNETLPAHVAEQADEAIKDSYMLDFLGIREPMLERDLEQKMVTQIRNVLLELGYGFSFIGNQYRIEANGKEYFIDLLFYHRRLKCLVAIELKTGAFKPEYAGKMNFYLNLLDDTVREADENPSIGIILCADRDHFEVEYALKGTTRPMGVAEYILTKELPSDLQGRLPNPKEMADKILPKMNQEKDD